MYENGRLVDKDELHEVFACFFASKINILATNSVIEQTVYNGRRKINCGSANFMTEANIRAAMKSIKVKNSE